MMKNAITAACRTLLAPIVRILLRNGVSWREFADLTKEVYVDVARRDYGVQGRPTNLARVAMMTGLSRREVSRVRDLIEGQKPQPAQASNRISAVLSGWHLDEDFQDADGAPAILTMSGPDHSIEALLARYAGDLPHGAFIKELLQLGLVREDENGFRVQARNSVRSASDPDLIHQAAVALRDHGTTLAFNIDGDRNAPARFERMATNHRLEHRHLDDFNTLVEQKGATLLEEVDAWLSARSPEKDENATTTVRAGLGMYLIQDET